MQVDLAERTVKNFLNHFDKSYEPLLYYAALPLILTPELLHYLRHNFTPQVPWVAEVDLLLSEDMCRERTFEQYTMHSNVRNYLLAEARKKIDIAEAARLLMGYLHDIERSRAYISLNDLQAQAWSAMVYMDKYRGKAVEQIEEAFRRAVGGNNISGITTNAEIERLAKLTEAFSSDLTNYPELLNYAQLVKKFVRNEFNQEDVEQAKNLKLGNVPSPLEIIGYKTESVSESRKTAWQSIQAPESAIGRFENITAFISSAYEDRYYSDRFSELLISLGMAVWTDRRIETQDSWQDVIYTAIDESEFVFVLVTQNSSQNESVLDEISAVFKLRKQIIIPIWIEGVVQPELSNYQHLDFRDNPQAAFDQLVKVLAKHFEATNIEHIIPMLIDAGWDTDPFALMDFTDDEDYSFNFVLVEKRTGEYAAGVYCISDNSISNLRDYARNYVFPHLQNESIYVAFVTNGKIILEIDRNSGQITHLERFPNPSELETINWRTSLDTGINSDTANVVNIKPKESGFRSGSYGAKQLQEFVDSYNNIVFYTVTEPTTSEVWVEWKAILPQSGLYNISVFVPQNHTTTALARYKVHGIKGQTDEVIVNINQRENKSKWVVLGHFEFDKNQANAGKVFLNDVTGENAKEIAFGPMRFRHIVEFRNVKGRDSEDDDRILGFLQKLGDKNQEMEFLSSLGTYYLQLSNFNVAQVYYEMALPLARFTKNLSQIAAILANLGQIYSSLDQLKKAIDFYEQALALKHEIGDRVGEAAILANLGGINNALGETAGALDIYQQALVLKREIGDRAGEAAILANLGGVYAVLGEIARALELYQQALVLKREIGDRAGEAAILARLGSASDVLGETARALELYQQALVLKREIGDRAGEASILANMGSVYTALGETARALELYQQALVLKREIGDQAGEAVILANVAALPTHDIGPTSELELIQRIHQTLIDRGWNTEPFSLVEPTSNGDQGYDLALQDNRTGKIIAAVQCKVGLANSNYETYAKNFTYPLLRNTSIIYFFITDGEIILEIDRNSGEIFYLNLFPKHEELDDTVRRISPPISQNTNEETVEVKNALIHILTFRGIGSAKEEGFLLKYGHTGVAFDQDNIIYGFGPVMETENEESILNRFRLGISVKGIIQDDSNIFLRAYELSKKGERSHVIIHSAEYKKDDYLIIRGKIFEAFIKKAVFPFAWLDANDPNVDGNSENIFHYNSIKIWAQFGINLPQTPTQMKFITELIDQGAGLWKPPTDVSQMLPDTNNVPNAKDETNEEIRMQFITAFYEFEETLDKIVFSRGAARNNELIIGIVQKWRLLGNTSIKIPRNYSLIVQHIQNVRSQMAHSPAEPPISELTQTLKQLQFLMDFLGGIRTATSQKQYSERSLNKIIKQGPLLMAVAKVGLGITTGYNEAFIISEDQRKALNHGASNSDQLIKPVLSGRNIKTWTANKPRQYIIYMQNDTDLANYPAIASYLESYRERLINRRRGKDHWYKLTRRGNPNDFEATKIIFPLLGRKIPFAIDREKFYLLNTAGYIIPHNDIDIFYLVALLNSNVIQYLIKAKSAQLNGDYNRITLKELEEMPVPDAGMLTQSEISTLVQQRLLEFDPIQALVLEKQINQRVYQLYQLTDDEIGDIEDGLEL